MLFLKMNSAIIWCTNEL